MIDYDYYYNQYRRVPRNSTTTHKDLIDYHSTATVSTYNILSGSIKRPVTTNYIDGSTLLGLNERPYSVKGLFPKGKGLRKPCTTCEKKIVNRYICKLQLLYYLDYFLQNTGDVFISLVPADRTILDTTTARSEKNRSPLSTATGTQYSTLLDVQRRSADIRNNRTYSATVFDDENSAAKFYGRCATTHANGAWVRRYKSITESQTLTDLLRDQEYKDEVLLRKKKSPQLFLLSSSKSSFSSSLIKRRLAQC